jgi:uncharacterized peroxidase-related enzyme
MAHIELSNTFPGIGGLMAYRPETGKVLSLLAQTLLRGPSTLSTLERELIATYVSHLNECHYCASSHGAAAMHLAGENREIVSRLLADPESAPISDKMKALLVIAGKVRKDGRLVAEEDIARARNEGATDIEIHDTVLIAAAFCMYNRYVDGLGTWAPEKPEEYEETGARLAQQGYVR